MNDATIAFVPRETVSRTLESLDSILTHTSTPHDLIIVIACYPEPLRAELRRIGREHGAEIVEMDGFVTPNEARNAALAKVKTEYVAFIDNDVEVRADWLGPLVACARMHQASVVGPMIFELYPPFTKIHMAGGEAGLVRPRNGTFSMRDIHYHAHETIGGDLRFAEAFETGLIEFHAVLVETAWLRSAGGLDPEFCSTEEHWDMCLQAKDAGKKIMIEPASEVNYSPPRMPTEDDIRFYNIRWSREWFTHDRRRLKKKYKVRRSGTAGTWKWVVGHRTHVSIQSVRSRFPKLSYPTARAITSRFLIPLIDMFPPRQLRADLKAWRERRAQR